MFSFLNQLSVRHRIWMIVVLLIGGVMLDGVIDVLSLRDALWREKQQKTRELVDTAYGVLTHFRALEERGELSTAEAQRVAIATVKAMRYDKTEYFWINDLGTPYPKMIMHPIAPELDGRVLNADSYNNRATSLRSGTDVAFAPATGKRNLFVAFTEVVAHADDGYVTYMWPRPKADSALADRLYPKLSCVRKFAPWGWLVGSGIYIDDIDAAVRKHAELSLLMVCGVGVLLLVLASALAHSIIGPLRRTISTMHGIGQSDGGLAQRLPVEGNSEIAEFTRGFNEMLRRLELRDAELVRHREHLEDEVAQRTLALRETNVHLAQEQKKIEALLKKMEAAQNQLVQSEKLASIGQLAAGVAHEINNPIGFVHSNLGTLSGYVKDMIELIAAYEQLE